MLLQLLLLLLLLAMRLCCCCSAAAAPAAPAALSVAAPPPPPRVTRAPLRGGHVWGFLSSGHIIALEAASGALGSKVSSSVLLLLQKRQRSEGKADVTFGPMLHTIGSCALIVFFGCFFLMFLSFLISAIFFNFMCFSF